MQTISAQLVRLAAIALGYTISMPQVTSAFPLPSELDNLTYFQGTWHCQQPVDSPTSDHVSFSWNVKRDLNNFWYIGYAEEMASETNLDVIDSREFLGYNAALERLVRNVVVGNGNSLSLTSSGWDKEEFIWEGTLVRRGELTPIRQVITKESNNRFSAIYFIRNYQNNEWKAAISEVCDRRL